MPRSDKLTKAQESFLRRLMQWDGIASPADLGPQTSQEENSTRQTCKRRGYVTFERADGYWRITTTGRALLDKEGK